ITLTFFLALALIGRWTGAIEAFTFFHPETTTHAPHPGYEDVTIPTPDGRELHAWFMPARGVDGRQDARHGVAGYPAPAVIHCHGNMGDISEHARTSAYITQ